MRGHSIPEPWQQQHTLQIRRQDYHDKASLLCATIFSLKTG